MMDQQNQEPSGASPRRLRPAFLLVFCLVFGMGAGVIFDRVALLAFVPSDAVSDFRLMAEAWNTIQRYYVDRAAVQPQALTYGAISGMVGALGDTGHSVFLTPEMVKQMGTLESGKLKGIGVEISMRQRRVVIVAPLDNSPAQRAGLQSGDIIISVDGRDVAGLSLDTVVGLISGPVGTTVKLAVLNPQTQELHNFVIRRATIKIQNVTWQQLPGTKVADLRIGSFTDDVSGDLRNALRAIQEQRLQGLILDLRNNPGGVLDEAVAVASQFLTNGNVLLVKDAKGTITPMPVQPGGLAPAIPLAVLINGGSASASEIVAGALNDAHRAMLVGETTFGTGTVLNQFPLPGGSALMLAVQEWLTPSGHSFWHKGIQPGLVVVLPPGASPLIPASDRDLTPAALQSSADEPLLRALKWVQEKIGDESTNQPAKVSGATKQLEKN